MLVDLTLTYDSDSPIEAQKYQMTGSVNGQFIFSRSMEGRLTATSLYQGRSISERNKFSQNYNVGLIYYTASNINLNVTYIFTQTNANVKITNG